MSAYHSKSNTGRANAKKDATKTPVSCEVALSLEAIRQRAKKDLLALCVKVGLNMLEMMFQQENIVGLWEGATENSAVCRELLTNLVDRGLRADGILVVIDGSKVLRRAVADVLGKHVPVQRCQVHKMRNVLDHLPEEQRPWVKRKLAAA